MKRRKGNGQLAMALAGQAHLGIVQSGRAAALRVLYGALAEHLEPHVELGRGLRSALALAIVSASRNGNSPVEHIGGWETQDLTIDLPYVHT
ncbi:hypothetical protein [Mesorhizobium temperatum]|uniref:hypothetical protein n=1 Tax=Mesorhizobium temperatum TaxID=241416 RepID=UPI0011814843|nr:hypothetical protein [Mesorhizobium temperatum]